MQCVAREIVRLSRWVVLVWLVAVHKHGMICKHFVTLIKMTHYLSYTIRRTRTTSPFNVNYIRHSTSSVPRCLGNNVRSASAPIESVFFLQHFFVEFVLSLSRYFGASIVLFYTIVFIVLVSNFKSVVFKNAERGDFTNHSYP